MPCQIAPVASPGHCVRRVLVTNDDGYGATGLEHLIRLAESLAEEVWVVAPEQDQSGASQSLTLHQPLRVSEKRDRCFAVRGTPSDCVLLGAWQLMPERPDLVLSGINHGINIADTVGFSGTLGAASTAARFNIPAIALSQAFRDSANIHWQTACTYAPDLVRHLMQDTPPAGLVVNINFPAVPPEQVRGVMNASMNGVSLVAPELERRHDGRGKEYFWLSFNHRYADVQGPASDVQVLREGAIAVSFIERKLSQGLNQKLFGMLAQAMAS